MTLTADVARSAAGQRLSAVTGSSSEGDVYATVAEALEAVEVEVLVDFTSAAAVRHNVWTAVEAGVHTVVGSSGLTADDYSELDRLARDRTTGVIAAGNFSIQAAVLQQAAKLAAEHLDRWKIIDYASAKKSDVPSGTARQLAEAVSKVRVTTHAVLLADLRGPVEARGGDVAGSRVHSVRLPSFVVSTEIVFGGTGERADHATRWGRVRQPVRRWHPCGDPQGGGSVGRATRPRLPAVE
ncbi:MAG: 4-hydroxy-tetrahydrodipicolinate reductase [Actinomycetota bacterium]|nr:4-hydroxy-tetrahydrodipicolinate reductase [Actinomycetota bacterium]